MDHHSHEVIRSLVLLLFVTSVASMAVHRREFPYTVFLVVIGLALGLFHVESGIHFTPDLVLLVFLPALLFEAAWNVHLSELKANWLPIGILSVGGVLISTAIVGTALALSGALPWGFALLFGAMISATDPVSVVATFRALGMNPRLTTLVEGESLFNDGTAVVLFQILSGIVLAGVAVHPLAPVGQFAYTVLAAVGVGLLVGFVVSRMIITIDFHLPEVTLTTVAAYGTFLLAEQVHASGIIATVVAGLVVGNYGRPKGMSENTQHAVDYFWEYAAFLANSLLFILLGAQIHLEALWPMVGAVAIAVAAVLVGRVVSVYPLVALSNRLGPPIRLFWQHVLVWGGLRGALSMALVLSLPEATPHRQTLVNLVFGVVLFSLLVQGLTVGPWLKKRKDDPRYALSGGAIAEA